MPIPFRFSFWMMAKSASTSAAASAAVGSSSTTILLLSSTTRAMATICCWATLSLPVIVSGGTASPISASTAAARRFISLKS